MTNTGTILKVIDLDGSEHAVTQSGLFFAYGDRLSAMPLTIIHDAARIPDFGRNLKRPKAIMDRVRNCGYEFETRYDAAHGRRYMLGCYEGAEKRERQRRVVLAAMDGLFNLRQHQIDCGISAEELDRLVAD